MIDYFTEKWNEKRSNGKSGEMKEFNYVKKKLNMFKKSGDAGYKAYRDTKLQKLCTNEGKVINWRKLNEFVNVINLLQDEKMKIKLFKEEIYFNYEFMTAKALSRDMYFVVENHENILSLKDDELIDVSQIYIEQFPSIENKPKTLIFKVLSRLESRSECVRQFLLSSNLLFQSYVKGEIVKNIYVCGESFSYYLINDSSYLFVKKGLELILLNSKTKKKLGQMTVESNEPLQIIIYNDKDLSNIWDINGKVYYSNQNAVFSKSFKNEVSTIKRFNERINEILLLNYNLMLVLASKSIYLLNLNDYTIHQEITNESEQLKFYKSTIKNERVYSADFYSQIECVLIATVSFKEMKIYQFNKNNERLDLIFKSNNIIPAFVRLLQIDGSSSKIRIAVANNDAIEIIDIENKKAKHSIAIIENEFKLDKVNLLGFYKDTLLIDVEMTLYFYDLERKKIFYKNDLLFDWDFQLQKETSNVCFLNDLLVVYSSPLLRLFDLKLLEGSHLEEICHFELNGSFKDFLSF